MTKEEQAYATTLNIFGSDDALEPDLVQALLDHEHHLADSGYIPAHPLPEE